MAHGRPRRRKRIARALVAGAVILGGALAVSLLGVPSCVETPGLVGGSAIAPVDFWRWGSQEGRTGFNAHVPVVGGWGDADYRFRGQIGFEDRRFRVDLDYQPLGVYRVEAHYLLLTRDYFGKSDFRWYAFEERTGQCVEADVCQLPMPVKLLQFDDRELGRRYRTWLLSDCADRQGVESVLDIYFLTAQSAPDLLLDQAFAKDRSRGRSIALLDFFRLLAEVPRSDDRAWDGSIALLEGAEWSVDPQELIFLGMALLRIDRERAEAYLKSYLAKARAEGVPDDMRVYGIESVLKQDREYRKQAGDSPATGG